MADFTAGRVFDADFFGNLRALGERPEYCFGYLVTSRRPLKELCREHLTDAQRPSDLGLLWTREVAPLTGRHPILIQMVLAHRWNAWFEGFDYDRDRIEQSLRDHLEDLWFNRHGKEE